MWGFRCRVQGVGFQVKGSGCGVSSVGFRMWGFRCRVQSVGVRVVCPSPPAGIGWCAASHINI